MFVGQIINGPNNDGDFDIKFMERSCKIKDGFVFPKLEDLAFVKRSNVVCKLANPIAAAARGAERNLGPRGKNFV